MSCYEWEEGTFVLPSAEFASFRQEMQQVEQEHQEQVFQHTQDCWQQLTRKQQTDPTAYTRAVAHYFDDPTGPDTSDEAVSDARRMLGSQVRREYYTDPETGGTRVRMTGKPQRVRRGNMVFPTNRTTEFGNKDCTITFDRDRRAVTWGVPENNHAVDDARSSRLGQAFFDRLDRVRWTHGTGGAIAGNDEYSREASDVGGGGNYCTGAYGYLGIQEEPMSAQPFTNAKGERIEVEVKMGRFGMTGKPVKASSRPQGGYGPGRVPRGVPTGGQFAGRSRGEGDVRL